MAEMKVNLTTTNQVKDFVNCMSTFPFDIDLKSGHYIIDAKSIMGVFSLDLSKNIQVVPSTEDDYQLSKISDAIEKFQA